MHQCLSIMSERARIPFEFLSSEGRNIELLLLGNHRIVPGMMCTSCIPRVIHNSFKFKRSCVERVREFFEPRILLTTLGRCVLQFLQSSFCQPDMVN